MSLIDDLGGYEEAKNFINGECVDGFDVQELRNALLEYRREHNIFECGDLVVLLNLDNNKAYEVDKVYEHKLFDSGIYAYSNYVCTLKGWAFEQWFGKQNIRHATAEEIAAGRRLP